MPGMEQQPCNPSPGPQSTQVADCPLGAQSPASAVSAGMRPHCEIAVFIDGPLALAGESGQSRGVWTKQGLALPSGRA